MKPVTVTTTIDRPREEIYALLDDLPSHEAFTDHFIVDWRPTDTGVRVRGKGGGEMEITVAESTPDRIVEHGRSGKDMRRRTKGIYTLEPAGASRTVVSFTNEIEPAGVGDRLMGPLMRAYLRRQNGRALERLKALMEDAPARTAAG